MTLNTAAIALPDGRVSIFVIWRSYRTITAVTLISEPMFVYAFYPGVSTLSGVVASYTSMTSRSFDRMKSLNIPTRVSFHMPLMFTLEIRTTFILTFVVKGAAIGLFVSSLYMAFYEVNCVISLGRAVHACPPSFSCSVSG
jgi:hypothetical protein